MPQGCVAANPFLAKNQRKIESEYEGETLLFGPCFARILLAWRATSYCFSVVRSRIQAKSALLGAEVEWATRPSEGTGGRVRGSTHR